MKRRETMNHSIVPDQGFGLGLRPMHYSEAYDPAQKAGSSVSGGSPVSCVSWFEVVTENFLGDGGRPLSVLEKVTRNYPIAFHGVSGSLGSTDEIDWTYYKKVKTLVDRFQPFLVSDHCCWTRVAGQNFHDLLPLPFTRATARLVSSRILQVQDFLKRRILIENVSSYLSFAVDEMTEWEFLTEILETADCGLLLDVNNIYVSSVNHDFQAQDYLAGIPKNRVGQIHLAGHSTRLLANGKKYLIDTHDHPVCDEVWNLYRLAVQRFGSINTMVEWDAQIPEYNVLLNEISKARQIKEQVHARASTPELPQGLSTQLAHTVAEPVAR